MPFLSIIMSFLNIKKLIPFFLQNWKAIIIFAMVGLLAYQNFSDTRFLFGAETIPSLNKQLEAATKAVKTCKVGNDVLSASIDERNNEVEKWRVLTVKLEDNIILLQTDLNTARVKLEADVDSILQEKTPESCENAIEYLRNSREELKWDD